MNELMTYSSRGSAGVVAIYLFDDTLQHGLQVGAERSRAQ